MTTALGLMSAANSLMIALGTFLMAQGAGKNIRSLLEAGLNRRIAAKNRATFLSCVSFISRIGMFASLAIISFTIDRLSEISQIFLLSAVSTVGLIPFFSLWNKERVEYSSFEVQSGEKI